MIRAVAVILIAATCVALLGVDGIVMTAQSDPARQRQIAERVARMKAGDIVKGERADGTKFEGVLVAKTTDSVTVDVFRRRALRRRQQLGTETFTLVNLRDIKKPLTGGQQAALTAAIVVGACAVAAGVVAVSSELKPGDGQPDEFDGTPGNNPNAPEMPPTEPRPLAVP